MKSKKLTARDIFGDFMMELHDMAVVDDRRLTSGSILEMEDISLAYVGSTTDEYHSEMLNMKFLARCKAGGVAKVDVIKYHGNRARVSVEHYIADDKGDYYCAKTGYCYNPETAADKFSNDEKYYRCKGDDFIKYIKGIEDRVEKLLPKKRGLLGFFA